MSDDAGSRLVAHTHFVGSGLGISKKKGVLRMQFRIRKPKVTILFWL